MKLTRIIIAGAATIAVCLTLTACGPLHDKSFVAEADGTGIKGSTVADSSSGTPAPSFWMGVFNFLLLTHPKDAPSICFYKQSSATFNASAKTTTFVWIGNGTKANLTVEPDKVVDLPGLKVVSGSNTINITANDSTDSASVHESLPASATTDSASTH